MAQHDSNARQHHADEPRNPGRRIFLRAAAATAAAAS
ncbi:hypothetical protein GA0115259_108571, partial [Streptomyces sp. MnatMP-M17]